MNRASRGAATLLVAGSAATFHAVGQVRRLRTRATTVPPLDHDIDLPGVAPPRRVVVIGDSAAAGHGLEHADAALARRLGRALVARDGRATRVRCLAVDGATTAQVLATQLDATWDGEVVVIGVGVNDAIRAHALADVEADLRWLLHGVQARVREAGQVVLISCPDLSAAPALPGLFRPIVGRRCRAMARMQARVADEHDVPVVAVDRAALPPAVFGDDGFHPGALGHERLAARVLELLG